MEKIIILDFGSQYTQLIARVIRECNVFCEIIPYNKNISFDSSVKGIILSGSPCSVNESNAPWVDVKAIAAQAPVLGICYGAQLITKTMGGLVEKSNKREYGRTTFFIDKKDPFFANIEPTSEVWMSHSDSISKLPDNCIRLGHTDSIPVAAFKSNDANLFPIYGLQFHPEVYHSAHGKKMIFNFLVGICTCSQEWTSAHFISECIEQLRSQIGTGKVVMGLSGGVDSTVAATLIHRAIGNNLHGIFVDNGLLRKNEYDEVLAIYKQLGLNVNGIDARNYFYNKLEGKILPEEKRKSIGAAFIEIFDREAHQIDGVEFLGQGTIYPDVIESASVHGPSVTIKSHHNVGGLPEKMKLKLVEPLRSLFKDEVRKIGTELGIPNHLLNRLEMWRIFPQHSRLKANPWTKTCNC